MAAFATESGITDEATYWEQLAQERLGRVQSMFYDGWFRDFDSRDGKPIILPDYYDVMMLSPLTVRVATPEQVQAVRSRIGYFRDNPSYWQEWPSFMQAFSEAAWEAGERLLLAQVLYQTGQRIYQRTDSRRIKMPIQIATGQPQQFSQAGLLSLAEYLSYRIPGVASEWWPIFTPESQTEPDLLEPQDPSLYLGGENYGWSHLSCPACATGRLRAGRLF
jgi:hypothetical protein